MNRILLIASIIIVGSAALTANLALAKGKYNTRTSAVDIDSTLVMPPVDQEVCFSPEESCDIKLIKFVESANQSIDVAIYSIDLDQLAHQLLLKSKKIPVKIIVDKLQSKGKYSLVRLLIKAGAEVRYGHQRGVFHNKFTIVDSKMIETGSYNYTNHATQANSENQYYSSTPAVVERYHNQFQDLWDKAIPAY